MSTKKSRNWPRSLAKFLDLFLKALPWSLVCVALLNGGWAWLALALIVSLSGALLRRTSRGSAAAPIRGEASKNKIEKNEAA